MRNVSPRDQDHKKNEVTGPMRLILMLCTALLGLSACNSLMIRDKSEPSGAEQTAAEGSAEDLSGTDARTVARAEALQSLAHASEPDQDAAASLADMDASERVQAVAEPVDLWQRMRGQFALQGYDHARVTPHLEWYARHGHYLERVAERAEPFLRLIVDEVERRRMPGEIALLPVVESAFQPFAYSHGRAAGIWQFIPGTGRRYGLKQNWWYDGRRDVLAATNAALDYLEDLHQRFDGDWLLALAAYNSGEGTVARAVRRNRKKGLPTTFWYLDLPRETESYVPKLLAVSAIVAAPADYDVTLAPIVDQPQLVVVDIGGQMDLALAAELADMAIEDLYRLNPGFNRWATDPDGPHQLLIPVDRSEVFQERLADLPTEQRLRWERYKIRSGDSLISIARHYRTTPAMLKRVNELSGNTIVTGKHLLIPVASKSFQDYSLAAEQRRSSLRERNRPKGEKVVHMVRNGDTFWDIARRYGVSVRKLAAWNGMAPRDVLRPGQKLVLWQPSRTAAARVTPVAHTLPVAATVRSVHYTVRQGDSLSRIASRFRVSVDDLRRWNGLRKGSYLQPGQRLTLYVDVTRQSGSG